MHSLCKVHHTLISFIWLKKLFWLLPIPSPWFPSSSLSLPSYWLAVLRLAEEQFFSISEIWLILIGTTWWPNSIWRNNVNGRREINVNGWLIDRLLSYDHVTQYFLDWKIYAICLLYTRRIRVKCFLDWFVNESFQLV